MLLIEKPTINKKANRRNSAQPSYIKVYEGDRIGMFKIIYPFVKNKATENIILHEDFKNQEGQEVLLFEITNLTQEAIYLAVSHSFETSDFFEVSEEDSILEILDKIESKGYVISLEINSQNVNIFNITGQSNGDGYIKPEDQLPEDQGEIKTDENTAYILTDKGFEVLNTKTNASRRTGWHGIEVPIAWNYVREKKEDVYFIKIANSGSPLFDDDSILDFSEESGELLVGLKDDLKRGLSFLYGANKKPNQITSLILQGESDTKIQSNGYDPSVEYYDNYLPVIRTIKRILGNKPPIIDFLLPDLIKARIGTSETIARVNEAKLKVAEEFGNITYDLSGFSYQADKLHISREGVYNIAKEIINLK